MSPKIFANIANENYTSGANLAMEKKELTIHQIRNDLMGVMQKNNVVTMMANPVYNSAKFNAGSSLGLYAGDRGTIIHKTKREGGLRKTKITKMQLYPLDSGEAVIKIIDGTVETWYEVELVANSVNTFTADYTLQTREAKVVIDQSSIRLASTPIICHKGCNNQVPNNCAWTEGWDGTAVVKSEGYGINLQFVCECDYDQVICDIKAMGEIIWLKWQINILKEQYETNRFNNWVIYGSDKLPAIIEQREAEYINKWNEMMDGVFGILNQYRDECLNCRGIRWRPNI